MKKSPNSAVEKALSIINKKYIAIGEQRVSPFYVWLTLGLAAGVIGAVAFVSSWNNGEWTLESSEAARAARPVYSAWSVVQEGTCEGKTSATVQCRERSLRNRVVERGRRKTITAAGFQTRSCVKNCEGLVQGGVNTAPFGYIDIPIKDELIIGNITVDGWVADKEDASVANIGFTVDGQPVPITVQRYNRPDVCATSWVQERLGLVGRESQCNAQKQPLGVRFLWNTSGLSSSYHTIAIKASDAGGLSNSTIGQRKVRGQFSLLADPVVVAVGDIACGKENAGLRCKQKETSDAALSLNPDAVLVLGDTQYERGQYQNYLDYYDPSWGRLKSKTYPAVGNHEYLTPDAAGYFDYFNGIGNSIGRAGDRDKGYYAFNLGNWRIYSINSMCGKVGGCGPDSPQTQWLKNDLRENPKSCQAIYMHYTIWTSDGVGPGRGNPGPALAFLKPLLREFYDAGGDLALVGHSHVYERFAPQNLESQVDTAYGIRQITIGTGGKSLLLGTGERVANSEVFDASAFGVLKLKLRSDAYDWQFLPIPGGSTFTDSGSTACHGAPPASQVVLPVISSLSLAEGPVGTQVTITGAGFTPTGNTVEFGVGGYTQKIASFDNGRTIRFTVPATVDLCGLDGSVCAIESQPVLPNLQSVLPGTYNVSVINANGASNSKSFKVTEGGGGGATLRIVPSKINAYYYWAPIPYRG